MEENIIDGMIDNCDPPKDLQEEALDISSSNKEEPCISPSQVSTMEHHIHEVEGRDSGPS
jgi:hypothetical protein